MQPIILTILDGWGLSKETRGNAIAQAKTPTIDYIEKFYPAISLQASGIAVGLPWDEAGNSEVGHLTLGAGRIIYQSLPRIVLSIKDGSFFKNPAFKKAIEHAKNNKSSLHLIGLVSSGNVHSYIDHVYGLIELAKQQNVDKLCLHIFTDGEDSPSKEAADFLQAVEKKLSELKDAKISTIIGRIYAMDRNKNWDRTQKAYECLVNAKGITGKNPIKEIKKAYDKDLTDTFIEPIILTDKNKHPLGKIQDKDSVIFFNFRKDRACQLAKAFIDPEFKEFPRKQIKNLCFVTMTQYEENLPAEIAFQPIEIKNHLTEILNTKDKKVLKIAETEKYAHVTYFFNGRTEKPYPNEKRILIPSTATARYDEHPEMSASKVTEKIIQATNENKFDLIVVNYANTDIIGHTGNFQAAIKATEAVDSSIAPLLKLVTEKNYTLLITADHGNAEQMLNLRTGEPYPEHTINPVPFYLVSAKYKKKSTVNALHVQKGKPQGILCDIAPTILELMQIPKPPEMTGHSLLEILK